MSDELMNELMKEAQRLTAEGKSPGEVRDILKIDLKQVYAWTRGVNAAAVEALRSGLSGGSNSGNGNGGSNGNGGGSGAPATATVRRATIGRPPNLEKLDSQEEMLLQKLREIEEKRKQIIESRKLRVVLAEPTAEGLPQFEISKDGLSFVLPFDIKDQLIEMLMNLEMESADDAVPA
jgi:DNA-directed RNA polymerase specialized sigma subunit